MPKRRFFLLKSNKHYDVYDVSKPATYCMVLYVTSNTGGIMVIDASSCIKIPCCPISQHQGFRKAAITHQIGSLNWHIPATVP